MPHKISSSNRATRLSSPDRGWLMNFPPIRGPILALAACCAILLAAPALRAQQDTPPASGQTGTQGGAPPASGQSADQGTTPPEAAAPSAPGPVEGAEEYRFPSTTSGRSFFVPRLMVQEVYNTNPVFAATATSAQGDSVSTVMGGMSLQVVSRNSTFAMDLASEGIFYNPKYLPNAAEQQLNVTEKIAARRWNLLFGESFSYLSNSAFGLGGLGFLGGGTTGLSGVGSVTGFNPFQIPTQTIGSATVSEFSSASIFQAQYLISGRNSVNASADVGFLHFFNSSLLDSRDILARFGYDHSPTARDTFSFSYTATILSYPSGISGFTSHAVQLGYRRLVTGRLQFTAAAGPSVSHFTPMPGATTVPGGQNLVDFFVFSSLNYALRRGDLGAQYTHGVGNGSGLLIGSIADQFNGNFSHQLSRTVRVSFTGGFVHNSAIQQTAGMLMNPSSSFDYWNAGAALSRPIGHYSSISLTYNALRQTTNTTVCVNMLRCGPISLVQTAGMTINWSTRPFKID